MNKNDRAKFFNEVKELRRQKDFTFIDDAGKTWTGDAAIAKHFGMSTIAFRGYMAIANYEARNLNGSHGCIIPCEDDSNGRYYIELPDGYRLIYDNDGYQGRYNPNLAEVI